MFFSRIAAIIGVVPRKSLGTVEDRLTEAGLWYDPYDPPTNWTAELAMRRWQIQAETTNDHPHLPIFYLERAETAYLADLLTQILVDEHAGQHSLTKVELPRRLYSQPHHTRDLPDIVLSLLAEEGIAENDQRELLVETWITVEYPEANGDTDMWVDAFRAVGWVSDDDSERPTTPIALYRGAVAERSRGMAWTDDVEMATFFARRVVGNEGGVWSTTITNPEALLGRFVGRNESEYVLDPNYLDNVTERRP